MANLVIVESPSKAKTIGKYLGPDFAVKASMGHLRDLPKSTMGVDLEGGFTPRYIPVKGKEDLIKELKSAAASAQQISSKEFAHRFLCNNIALSAVIAVCCAESGQFNIVQ